MTAREALKKLREKGSLDEMIGMIIGDPLTRAIEALEREADAEEKARPKVTLKEQVEALRWASTLTGMGPSVAAAADTLRYLEEGGGRLLLGQDQAARGAVGPSKLAYAQFLRSLGVEPRS